MLNYLARLGWSHGDDELFSAEQMITWFDGSHLAKSPAQWDAAKLSWVNAHYVKQADNGRLAALVQGQLAKRGIEVPADERLATMCGLFKDRCTTTVELADWLQIYFGPISASEAERTQHLTEAVRPAIASLAARLQACAWEKSAISAAIKETITEHGLKMPQLAMPVRVLVCGRAQTPSVDAVLELFEQKIVVERLQSF
jgi:glutamyl-tRNA synthetase